MKVNLTTVITDLFGKPIKNGTSDRDLTVRVAMANGLLSETEPNATGAEKYRRYALAVRLADERVTVINLSTEEAALIKAAVGRAFGAVIVGPVFNAIDPPAPTPEAS